MAKLTTRKTLPALLKTLTPFRRVLLINPPVHETNYRWLRWSQPNDLLKLGGWLTRDFGADVRLYDWLTPVGTGQTPRNKLAEQWDIHGHLIDAWHFGRPLDDFRKTLGQWDREGRWRPDVVIITTLTSYWLSGLYMLLTAIRNLGRSYRDVPIAVMGNLPRYAPKLTTALPAVTHIAPTKGLPVNAPVAMDLYRRTGVTPRFCALDVNSPYLVREVQGHLRNGMSLFTFFNDDLFGQKSRLEALAKSKVIDPRKARIDVICGVKASQLTVERLRQLHSIGARTACVEHEVDKAGELNRDAYERLGRTTTAERILDQPGHLSGFVEFGRPNEEFDRVVLHTLLINKLIGGIILKPIGAQWDTLSEDECAKRWPRPEDQSPHALPYMRENKVSYNDYLNLYRWQALVNYKSRGTTYDFLSNSRVGRMARQSMLTDSWTLPTIMREAERAKKERQAHRATVPPTSL